jgi:uncharacterized membrane protein/protein-disulfide isomerase
MLGTNALSAGVLLEVEVIQGDMEAPKPRKIFAPIDTPVPKFPFNLPLELVLLWGVRTAAGVAVLLSVYLAYATWFSDGTVAGCGDETSAECQNVLNSRWSRWLGLPMGLWSLLLYAGLLTATFFSEKPIPDEKRRCAWLGLTAGGLLAAGGAMWFIALQLLSLHKWCWFCATVHLCGFAIAGWVAWRLPPLLIEGELKLIELKKAAVASGVALVLLMLGQLLFNSAPGMKVVSGDELATPAEVQPTSDDALATKPGKPKPPVEPDLAAKLPSLRKPRHPWRHRRITLINGGMSLDTYDYPVLGERESGTPVAKLFDYTCDHCRELAAMLDRAEQKFADRPSMILVCVPMNKQCNRHVRADDEKHRYACELARLAIAVWQSNPEKFAEFHRWTMSGATAPEPAAARAEAARLLGQAELQKALADPAVEAQLAENARLYSVARDNSRDGSIPKLIFGNSVASGLPSSQTQLELLLEAQGLTRKSD